MARFLGGELATTSDYFFEGILSTMATAFNELVVTML